MVVEGRNATCRVLGEIPSRLLPSAGVGLDPKAVPGVQAKGRQSDMWSVPGTANGGGGKTALALQDLQSETRRQAELLFVISTHWSFFRVPVTERSWQGGTSPSVPPRSPDLGAPLPGAQQERTEELL